jgi:hypothetical protein
MRRLADTCTSCLTEAADISNGEEPMKNVVLLAVLAVNLVGAAPPFAQTSTADHRRRSGIHRMQNPVRDHQRR